MTQREAQILKWIEENPMITQQEIAQRANITRASVGVHISNLMKKGYVVGKGYILQNRQYVCVVGAVNIDISGTPYSALHPNDSNPGHTALSLGGVGRNIAENMSRLGVKVELITVLGEDSYSREIQHNCRQVGMGLTHTQLLPGERTSTYLCINDHRGEMQLAVSDMEIYRHLTPEYLRGKLEILNSSAACVVDTNIPVESLEFLMDHCKAPLFLDPVSIKKTEKLRPILHNVHTVKPNLLEAQILAGMEIHSDHDLEEAARRIRQMGVRQVLISMGGRGIYFSDGQVQGICPCVDTQLVNSTGAGDSFLGAVVWSFLRGDSLEQMVRSGQAAAAICIASPSTVSQQISAQAVEQTRDGFYRGK